jgi:hypothetical protein
MNEASCSSQINHQINILMQLWSSSGVDEIACDVEACLPSGSQDKDILRIQDIQIDVIANVNAA